MRDESWEPTDEDVRDLAIVIAAAWVDGCYTEAAKHFDSHPMYTAFLRIAQTVFDHPGYTPSIKAARIEAYEGGKSRIRSLEAEVTSLHNELRLRSDTIRSKEASVERLREEVDSLKADTRELTLLREAAKGGMTTIRVVGDRLEWVVVNESGWTEYRPIPKITEQDWRQAIDLVRRFNVPIVKADAPPLESCYITPILLPEELNREGSYVANATNHSTPVTHTKPLPAKALR